MVRKAIEDIKYRGGSTLTSRAVQLAVQDLQRGRRIDALQVNKMMIEDEIWHRGPTTDGEQRDARGFFL